MAAKNKRTRQRPQSARFDAIEALSATMRAVEERDRALKEVIRLRDAGKVRAAKAKFKEAERLQARVEALERELPGGGAEHTAFAEVRDRLKRRQGYALCDRAAVPPGPSRPCRLWASIPVRP